MRVEGWGFRVQGSGFRMESWQKLKHWYSICTQRVGVVQCEKMHNEFRVVPMLQSPPFQANASSLKVNLLEAGVVRFLLGIHRKRV